MAHTCMHNATMLQVHFLFLDVSEEGGTYSKGHVAERGKKNEWEQMMH